MSEPPFETLFGELDSDKPEGGMVRQGILYDDLPMDRGLGRFRGKK